MTLECFGRELRDTVDRPSQRLKIRRLGLVLTLLTGLSIAELLIGYRSQHLSLLADAGHVASDAGAIALTLLAVWIGYGFQPRLQPFLQRKGIQQLETVVALINGVSLLVISSGVLIAAILRLQSQSTSNHYTATVLLTAIASFIINGCNVLWLKGCSHHDLNLTSAFLHVLADMVGALGVILGITAEYYLGVGNADAIASLITSIIIGLASLPLVIKSWRSLGINPVPNLCRCHSEKQDLEKVLFPSLEQLVL